jgi:hypothetical protein
METTMSENMVAPGEGWKLVVRRRFLSGGAVYDRGCEITPEVLGKNFQSFFDRGFVRWQPPGSEASPVTPRKIEVAPPKIEHRQAVVADAGDCDDALDRWQTSVALTMTASNCDEPTAKVLLMAHREGSEVYKLASRIASERHAAEHGLVGRRIFQHI